MESDDTIDYGSIMNVFTPGTLKTVCGAGPALPGTRQKKIDQLQATIIHKCTDKLKKTGACNEVIS